MDVCIVVGIVVCVVECMSVGVVLCMIVGVVLIRCLHSVDQDSVRSFFHDCPPGMLPKLFIE